MGLSNDSPDSISIVYRFVLVNSIVRLVKWKADRFCFFNWMWCTHWLHQTSKGCIIHSTWAFTELSFTQTRIIHSTQTFYRNKSYHTHVMLWIYGDRKSQMKTDTAGQSKYLAVSNEKAEFLFSQNFWSMALGCRLKSVLVQSCNSRS